MADREKVINELRFQLNSKEVKEHHVPIQLAVRDAEKILAILKELDAREPHYTTLRYLVNGIEVVIQHPECPRCIENGLALWDAEIEKGQAYCKRCGQAVKWDE